MAEDFIEEHLKGLRKFATILEPKDVDEPILAPKVASAIYEWLVELRSVVALEEVGVKPRRLALLYGPPGTGKTTLAHHLAARLGVPLVAVKTERIISKFLGETGQNVGRLFDLLDPIAGSCVLLLDEFDALAAARGRGNGNTDHEMERVLATLLPRLEAFAGVGLAATNAKHTIDPAVWRRFGLQISVDLPGMEERFAIVRKYLLPMDLPDEAIDVLVEVTRGSSPSLIRQLMEGAKRALVLGPKLKQDVSLPELVFGHVAASIAPPPEMQQPPLWEAPEQTLKRLRGLPWPPQKADQK